MARPALDMNIDAEMVTLALDVAPLIEESARVLAEQIKLRIPNTAVPSEPGEPPSSTGPYRDSWKSGKARRIGDFVQASTYSAPTEGIPAKLAAILEYGSRASGVAPRPHIRPAEEAREAIMNARIQAELSRLRRGG